MDLADYTLILPTRRATRAVSEAFLKASGGEAMLLPRIFPIAEGQEDLTLISEAVSGDGGSSDIPPAMREMERRLTLTCLVMRWAEAIRGGEDRAAHLGPSAPVPPGNTPAQAAQLAAELSRLMDMVETENVDYAGLAALVPDEHTEHWQKTLDFLQIVTQQWPMHLAERGLISTADRRNRLILAEARRYGVAPPPGPIIVAGVTGSVPATGELMRAVANLPNGAIVLPCLDTVLDDESWHAITPASDSHAGHPEHPQFGLKKLLTALGVSRSEVALLPGADLPAARQRRMELVSEALRPSSTTGRWAGFAEQARGAPPSDALDGLHLIEAPTAHDEAETIALILREAAETPGRTAALVSPDRLLARRVANRLEGWGIRVDDSAGRPFRKTVPGAFLDLVIEAAAKTYAPAELMALLKHPLTRLGLDPFAVRRAGRALEIAVFRRPYLGQGLSGIDAALERAALEAKRDSGKRTTQAVRRLWPEDWDGARDLIRRLVQAFAPLEVLFSADSRKPLSDFAAAHVAAAEALAALPVSNGAEGDDEAPPSPLWRGEAGRAAQAFFDELFAPGAMQPSITYFDYPDLYRSLLSAENVRPRVPVHPRLFIWGPFEARLQQADVMILGSLNEGTWPEAANPGPWLNRTMRKSLGLPSPEEKIGHAAHDFISFLGADTVILSRALKMDGVPTVPSRWLMRLTALLEGLGLSDDLKKNPKWLSWARSRDDVARDAPIAPPAPRPEVGLRPRKLSVSRIETWIANPYAIFAREILKLEPLARLGQDPGPDVRGSVIHAALAEFAHKHPEALPKDVRDELLELARHEFEELKAHPRVAAFWMPRFARFADWFAETEPARRRPTSRVVAETSGRLVLDAPLGVFSITARADRIDVTDTGLLITDYKTGQFPKPVKVNAGFAPQLPLEAAMAAGGHFEGVPAIQVTGLRYISASGGEPPGREQDVASANAGQLADKALEGLKTLIADFDKPETAYEPRRRSQFSYKYDDYAHLARVAEWSVDTAITEEE